MVPVKILKNAPYNPPRRIRFDAKMRDLRDSMGGLGQLTPILINKKHWIIDGHRRVVVASILGWKEIEAVIADGATAEAIYASINSASKALTGNDAMVVYTKNKEACPYRIRHRLEQFEAMCGFDLILKMADKGRSPSIFKVALSIINYLDKSDDKALFKKTALWLDNFNYGAYMEKAMIAGMEPNELLRCIENNRKVKVGLKLVDAMAS
jgi:hypothetical protein